MRLQCCWSRLELVERSSMVVNGPADSVKRAGRTAQAARRCLQRHCSKGSDPSRSKLVGLQLSLRVCFACADDPVSPNVRRHVKARLSTWTIVRGPLGTPGVSQYL